MYSMPRNEAGITDFKIESDMLSRASRRSHIKTIRWGDAEKFSGRHRLS